RGTPSRAGARSCGGPSPRRAGPAPRPRRPRPGRPGRARGRGRCRPRSSERLPTVEAPAVVALHEREAHLDGGLAGLHEAGGQVGEELGLLVPARVLDLEALAVGAVPGAHPRRALLLDLGGELLLEPEAVGLLEDLHVARAPGPEERAP